MATVRYLSAFIGTDTSEANHTANLTDKRSDNTDVTTFYRAFPDSNALNIYLKRYRPTIVTVDSVTSFIDIPVTVEWIISSKEIPQEFISAHPHIKMACLHETFSVGFSILLHMGKPVKKALKLSTYAKHLSMAEPNLTAPKITFYNMDTVGKPVETKKEELESTIVPYPNLIQATGADKTRYSWIPEPATKSIRIMNFKSDTYFINYGVHIISIEGNSSRLVDFTHAGNLHARLQNKLWHYACSIETPGVLQIE
jgi:hypothetical protein